MRRLPRRRVDADAAARPRRRPHALAASTSASSCLFIATVDARDRPPAARSAEVPARPHVPGVRVRRRPRGRRVPRRHRVGDRPALHRSARTASASRPSPRTRSSSARSSSSASPASSPRRCASRSIGRPDVREVVVRRLPALVDLSTRWSVEHAAATCTAGCGASTSLAFLAFLVILPTTKLRHMFTSPMNMYLKDRDRPKGAMKPMPNLMETELETFGAVDDRGLHLEAAVRHRRVHDLRALHVGVPGARDRQAARPARDRAEGRRGDGRDRRPRRCRRRSASTATSRSPPTACSSASRPRSCGRARRARRATRSAR